MNGTVSQLNLPNDKQHASLEKPYHKHNDKKMQVFRWSALSNIKMYEMEKLIGWPAMPAHRQVHYSKAQSWNAA